MKLAFSTVCCPTWDLPTALSHAREYGYEGIELRGYLGEKSLTAIDAFAGDPAVLRAQFEAAGVAIACLSSSIRMSADRKTSAEHADRIRQYIDRAKATGCTLVKLSDTVLGRRNRATAAVALADWLAPLADYAAECDVSLVIENEFSFRFAQDIWRTLETLNHPAVGACWDVCAAAVAGERPGISVPTLNSRIQYVHVTDARLDPAGPIYCPIGSGDVAIRQFLTRLQGVGYTGWVTVWWDKATLPNLAGPEETLAPFARTLQEYVKLVHRSGHPAKHAAAPKPIV